MTMGEAGAIDQTRAPARAGASETAIRFDDVCRVFGSGNAAVRAVDGVSLDIMAGEFFALLGPSGSGKTTCLRLVAGFEQPDAGRVTLFGRDMAGVPPFKRDVNTVFQDYALFPHLSVRENVAYGPIARGVERRAALRAADEMLERVRLPGFGERRPAALSGGQRQRVALARALVNKPRVLLLDEPLGALDLKLREEMQVELKAMQRDIAITFVLVTHDQGEALSMSDRVAVFNRGRIEQVGTPEAIYDAPRTPFVADFVGVSNLVSGNEARALGIDQPFAIRPERIRFVEAGGYPGQVEGVLYYGAATRYQVRLGSGTLVAVIRPSEEPRRNLGDAARIAWDPRDLRLFDRP